MSHAPMWAFSKSHSTIDSWNGCLMPALSMVLPPPAFPTDIPSTTQVRTPSIVLDVEDLVLVGRRSPLRPEVVDVGEMGIGIQDGEALGRLRGERGHRSNPSYGIDALRGCFAPTCE